MVIEVGPAVQVGDEVLIRARVTDVGRPERIQVHIESTDQYNWVRRVHIAEVIPLEQTKTAKGFTVRATRTAIQQFDNRIRDLAVKVADPSQPAVELRTLELACLQGVRDDLVDQLHQIKVDPYGKEKS